MKNWYLEAAILLVIVPGIFAGLIGAFLNLSGKVIWDLISTIESLRGANPRRHR